jgi:serine/threonine protein kinase
MFPLINQCLFVFSAKSFIKKILVVDPEERFTAEQCLNDPWILEYTAPAKNLKRLQSFSVAKFKQYTEKYKEANAKPGYGHQ